VEPLSFGTFLLVALLVGWTGWSYLRRELPVRRRGVLIALRSATLALLAVLLTRPDLRLPGSEVDLGWTLVDASASMAFAAGDGRPAPALRAERRVGELGGEGSARAFGAGDSRLAPALRRAAEGGARRVRVLTDLRLSDGPLALGEAEALGLAVEVEDVGGPLPSAGIERLAAPATGRASEEVTVETVVFATAALAGEQAVVTLTRRDAGGGEVAVAADTVRLPSAGGGVALRRVVSLPGEGGTAIWSAAVAAPGDAVPADDRRHAVTRVDPLSGILALVSLRPDWEPRWLLPVLAEATGLPTRGWLRVGGDAFLSMGDGALLGADSLARVLSEARLAVVHGVEGGSAEWLGEALATAPRLLVLPEDAAGARAAGVDGGEGVLPGEWYPDAQGGGTFGSLFSGIDLALLPPLTGVIRFGTEAEGGSPLAPGLAITRPGGGEASALLLREEEGRRRTAVVAARGFWRWASRGGDPAEAYRRLFSGVAGWLLELEDEGVDPRVGPERTVVSAVGDVTWNLPSGEGVTLRWKGEDGDVEVDTVPAGTGQGDGVGGRRRVRRQAPAPGVTEWEIQTLSGADGPWRGVLVAEEWTDELRWPRDTLLAAGVRGGPGAVAAAAAPLRTTPWPWLLAIALLCVEWILRRRWGLR
jgi:hypothetical protein